MRLLLIEDDEKLSAYVSRGLSEEGHVCDVLADGQDALFHAMREPYDILIVDRMLPSLDGLSLVKALRAARKKTPALFLTSIGGVNDRVEGLEAGGDDYLVKPFAFSELLARVNALARRPPDIPEETILTLADLTMDLARRRVTRGDTT
ncbi:MAG: response regulator, partial [Rhizobiaceae bacterium]